MQYEDIGEVEYLRRRLEELYTLSSALCRASQYKSRLSSAGHSLKIELDITGSGEYRQFTNHNRYSNAEPPGTDKRERAVFETVVAVVLDHYQAEERAHIEALRKLGVTATSRLQGDETCSV